MAREPSRIQGYDRVVVLSIGVETYQNPPGRNAIGRVHYAEADAQAFADTIRVAYGHVEVDVSILKSAEASLTTIRETVRYLVNGLSPSDLFVMFYAGHGFHGDGSNRLTAFDTNPDNLGGTTLDLGREVLLPIGEGPCRRALLFVDACAVDIVRSARGRSILQSLDPGEIEAMLDDADYVGVFLSCSPGEQSYGAAAFQHGAFTAHLLQALNGQVEEALDAGRWLTDTSLRDWSRSPCNVM